MEFVEFDTTSPTLNPTTEVTDQYTECFSHCYGPNFDLEICSRTFTSLVPQFIFSRFDKRDLNQISNGKLSLSEIEERRKLKKAQKLSKLSFKKEKKILKAEEKYETKKVKKGGKIEEKKDKKDKKFDSKKQKKGKKFDNKKGKKSKKAASKHAKEQNSMDVLLALETVMSTIENKQDEIINALEEKRSKGLESLEKKKESYENQKDKKKEKKHEKISDKHSLKEKKFLVKGVSKQERIDAVGQYLSNTDNSISRFAPCAALGDQLDCLSDETCTLLSSASQNQFQAEVCYERYLDFLDNCTLSDSKCLLTFHDLHQQCFSFAQNAHKYLQQTGINLVKPVPEVADMPEIEVVTPSEVQ
eukprot:TRINITY_DN3559_c0_g1_i2.p2 TRINITY_DN3559_c0_g1~~TRINITY_DN3559_c0_g1_i2.p2  ORF type:complete len:359 (-),score=100.18 TRINITY_DN3559_c0_g1_i2:1407-2483(-)